MQIGLNGPVPEGSRAITNGGQVELHGIDSVDVNVGREAGAEGTLTVDGAGSRLFIHSALDPRLRLGRDGNSEGHATVQNGGEIEILGSRALLEVGRDGDGSTPQSTMVLASGSRVDLNGEAEGAFVRIGMNAGRHGAITVTGAGSELSPLGRGAFLYVGREGQGEMQDKMGRACWRERE